MVGMLRNSWRTLPPNAQGLCFIALSAAAAATMAGLIKVAGERLHVLEILFVRQVILMALLTPFVIRRRATILATKHFKLQLTRVALSAIAMTSGHTAILHLQLSEAVALNFSKNLFVAILAYFILKEKAGSRGWLVLLVGFAGVLLIARPSSMGVSLYVLAALVSSAAMALISIVVRQLSQSEPLISVLAYQAFGVGMVLILPGYFVWETPSLLEAVCLAVAGVSSAAGQIMNFAGFRIGQATVVTAADYLQLVFALILGYAIFGEHAQVTTLAGASLIIGATLYSLLRGTRHDAPENYSQKSGS